MDNEKEFILYGLGSFDKILGEISKIINGALDDFDLQLILSEALTNAFIPGNKRDITKPIYLRLKIEGTLIKFEIQDSGIGNKKFKISEEISEKTF